MSMGNSQPPGDGSVQGQTLSPAYDLLSKYGLAGIESALAEIPPDTSDYQRHLLAGLAAAVRGDQSSAEAHLSNLAVPEFDMTGAWLAGRALALCGAAAKALPHLTAAAAQRGANLTSGEAYRIGRISLAAGAWNEASGCFAYAVGLSPQMAPAHLGRGIAEFRAGRWKEAAASLRLALQQMPGSTEAIGFLGFTLVFNNEMNEAEALIQRALGEAPNWFEPRVRFGDLLLRRARFREARDWFAAFPGNPQSAWVRYFHSLAQQGVAREPFHLSGAEQALQELESDNEGYSFLPAGLASGWYTVGVAYLQARDYEHAVAPLERALELTPHRSHYRLQLATALFELRRFAGVLEVLQARTLEGMDGARSALLRGLCYLEMRDIPQALAAFRESAAADPMSADAFVALGRTSLIQGNFDHAERALATAVRINPRLASVKKAVHELEVAIGRRIDSGAGLGELKGFSIPPEFALNLSDEGLSRPHSLWAGLRSHSRAIQAIIRREILGRYGRSEIGYIWAILQPLIYVATLEAIFMVAQRRIPLGVTLEQFLITGIVPVVCFFMNIESKVTAAINANKSLLYFREVSTLNILVGAWLLEFLTAVTAMLVILIGLYLAGQPFFIKDKLEVLAALFGISCLAAVIGGLIGVLSLRWHSAIFIGTSLNRALFFLSGAFFYADELPPKLREYILINPLFHYVELVRDGFFVSYKAVYVSWTYPMLFTIPGLLLLLLTDRVFQRHVEA